MTYYRTSNHSAGDYLHAWSMEMPGPVPDMSHALRGFKGIDLDRLNEFKLLKRYDTKFVLKREQLQMVLDDLGGDYCALTIDGKQTFTYDTLYFDTEDGFFYRQHHDQRINRFKVRQRHYVDSGHCYVEVKRKTNKEKTIKTRMRLEDGRLENDLSETSRSFAKSCLNGFCQDVVDELRPSLRVHYGRMTLLNPVGEERLTFDVNLSYSDPFGYRTCNHLVIAELKHSRLLVKSRFLTLLRSLNIHPIKFSKYCMGMVMMDKHTKTNRFKKHIRLIEKLT